MNVYRITIKSNGRVTTKDYTADSLEWAIQLAKKESAEGAEVLHSEEIGPAQAAPSSQPSAPTKQGSNIWATIISIIIGLAVLYFLLPSQKPTVESHFNSSGGTMTITDGYGNKTNCTTMVIGQSISTNCR